MIKLTREFSFEMAHALEGYDGLCRHIHGHSYKLFVTVAGKVNDDQDDPKYGMVMDFGVLKGIVNELIVDRFDHSLLLRKTEKNEAFVASVDSQWSRIELTPYQPTCENMVLFIVDEVSKALPMGVNLVNVRLYETARSFAEWTL